MSLSTAGQAPLLVPDISSGPGSDHRSIDGLEHVKAFISLSKPRITTMVTLSTLVGYLAGTRGHVSWLILIITLIGTALCAGGAGALNNYLERDIDKQMKRTAKRPLPSGRLSANEALLFGIITVLAGVSLLALTVNLLTSFLALLTAFLYVLVYTPLKRVTWLNTLIGAIPGALPPLGGWAAAVGHLEPAAWILFFIMFFWQHPHFYAIAWMYRDDYGRAGFKMLPVVEPDGNSTFRQIMFFSVMLFVISVLPGLVGLSGVVYLSGATVLGAMMIIFGALLSHSRSTEDARYLLHASLAYLPLLYIFIVADLFLYIPK